MIVLIRKQDPTDSDPNLGPPCQQPPECRLLALPAELRNHIWSYLLIQDTSSDGTSGDDAIRREAALLLLPSPDRRRAAALSQAPIYLGRAAQISATILRTCRQAHLEGAAMLYGANVFDAHRTLLASMPALALRTAGCPALARPQARPVTHPRAVRRIRRFFVHVRLDVDARFSRAQAAAAFAGVAELEIEVFQSSYGTCDFGNLALFEDVRGVGRAVVQGSIGDGCYARHLERIMESDEGRVWPKYEERFIGGDRAWDAWTHGNR